VVMEATGVDTVATGADMVTAGARDLPMLTLWQSLRLTLNPDTAMDTVGTEGTAVTDTVDMEAMVMARGLPSPGAMEDTEATEEAMGATGGAMATAGANGQLMLMPMLWHFLRLRLSPDTDMEVMAAMVATDMAVTEDTDMARDLLSHGAMVDTEGTGEDMEATGAAMVMGGAKGLPML